MLNLEAKMKEWAIPGMFLILPLMVIMPGLIWKSHQLFFILMILPVIALTIRNVWVKAFLLYAFGWQMFLLWSVFANPRINPGPALSVMMAFMAGALIFKLVSEGDIDKEKWFTVIRIGALFQASIAVSQYFGFNPVVWFMALFIKARELMPGHFVGTLGNKDFLTAFIGISLPLFMGWRTLKWRIERPFGVDGVFPWNLSLNIPALVIIFILFFGPTPATLATIIGLSIYFNRGWRTLALGGFIALGVVYYYVVVQGVHLGEFEALPRQFNEFVQTGAVTPITGTAISGDLGRFGMWFSALGKLMSSWQRFVFGFGPAAPWGMPYPLHNEYMTVFFELGAFGLAILGGYIISTGRFLFRSKNILLGSCFAIAALDMTGNYTIHIAPTAFLVVVICGLIERERLNNG